MAQAAKIIEIGPQPLESIITEGRAEIGPELAARILAEAVYERQRQRRNPDVILWAERLRRGAFGARHQVWFGLLNGRLHLIDGQHRLAAVAESKMAAEFDVVIWPVASMDELHESYSSLDRGGRPRTLSEMLNARGIAEQHGLSKHITREVWRAGILVHFRFNPPHAEVDPLAVRDDNQRLAYAEPLWALAGAYEKLIAPAPHRVRTRLCGSQIMAVALVTLRHRPLEAQQFWSAVARNDGLRKGDPAHTLLVWLNEQMMSRAGFSGAIAAALAWNAHYERRQIGALKVGSVREIRIGGAPSKGPLV